VAARVNWLECVWRWCHLMHIRHSSCQPFASVKLRSLLGEESRRMLLYGGMESNEACLSISSRQRRNTIFLRPLFWIAAKLIVSMRSCWCARSALSFGKMAWIAAHAGLDAQGTSPLVEVESNT